MKPRDLPVECGDNLRPEVGVGFVRKLLGGPGAGVVNGGQNAVGNAGPPADSRYAQMNAVSSRSKTRFAGTKLAGAPSASRQ